MKRDGELGRRSRLRQCKYLNNIVEQDHRRIKRLVRPGLGFGGFRTARRTLAGFEAMAMIRKGRFERSADAISEDRRSSLPLFSIPPHKGDRIQFIPVLPSSAIVFATEPPNLLRILAGLRNRNVHGRDSRRPLNDDSQPAGMRK